SPTPSAPSKRRIPRTAVGARGPDSPSARSSATCRAVSRMVPGSRPLRDRSGPRTGLAALVNIGGPSPVAVTGNGNLTVDDLDGEGMHGDTSRVILNGRGVSRRRRQGLWAAGNPERRCRFDDHILAMVG